MLLYVHCSIAIILMGKRELVALLNLSSWCLVMVVWLFLAVLRGCLRFVAVVFPDDTHLLFWIGYLSCRRKKHQQILFYKMINGLCPDYLCSPVPPTVGNNTAYSLCNVSDYKYIRLNTQLYYNSFLRSVVCDWNEPPQTTRNAPSISSFKRSLNSTIIGVPLCIWTASALVKFIIVD